LPASQQFGDRSSFEILCEVFCGLVEKARSAGAPDSGVGTRLDEKSNDRDVVVDDSEHERRQAVLRGVIEVGSRVDENAYRLDVTVSSGAHECGLAESIERVDILSQTEKASKGGCVTPLRGILPVTLQHASTTLQHAST
jgi:hypothetical protein